jgi:hypothetical protein
MIRTLITCWAHTSAAGGPTLRLKHPQTAKTAYLSLKQGDAKLEIPLGREDLRQLLAAGNDVLEAMPFEATD